MSKASADQSEAPTDAPSEVKNYRLTFRENRKFELTIIGGDVLFFGPYGSQENVSESIVNAMTDYEKAFFIVEVM